MILLHLTRYLAASLGKLGVLCALCLVALSAHASDADDVPIARGFVSSTAIDPSTKLSVRIAIKNKADAPWVVLIHGLGKAASEDWAPLLTALSENYQILLLDLPGFGGSTLPDAALTPHKYAELVHFLVSTYAKEPVNVLGHSMGAAVALRYAHDYPQEVKRLLVIDAAGILQTTVFSRHLSKIPSQFEIMPALDTWIKRGAGMLNFVSGSLQDWSANASTTLQVLMSSEGARKFLYKDNSNINAALGLVNEDFTPLLRNLRAPTYILWGEQDPIAPLRTGIALAWSMPHARLTRLPHVGHM
ncbi:MAG: alpha/beta hydrolase, partial [Undibacterium sp.]|nr:alpha/beta hydrolase [Undibacterium sp.]